jgi:hypothetical protein
VKSLCSWKIRALGVLLLLTLAVGCSTGRHRDNWHNNNEFHDTDRSREGGWNFGRNAERNDDGRWNAERNSEGYSRGYSREDTH